jgi:hypothetical protein
MHDGKNKISGIYSQKKHGQNMAKTQKKLPDLTVGHYDGANKGRNVGFASDSDEAKMLPLIKGGGQMGLLNPTHHNSQISEAYSMKGNKKVSNQSF